MGRTILAEDFIEQYVEKLINNNKWYTGVIIGQQTVQRDYVVHVARTPDPVADEASEENEGESDDSSSKGGQSLERAATLNKLDEKWVLIHAKQVSRMLPGGLSVIGLFIMAPTSMLLANQTKSKQMLFSMYKSLLKNQMLTSTRDMDKILLQIDSSTKKMTCVTFDVTDNQKSSSKPADWKYQASGTKWTRLDSHVNLDIHFAVPREGKAHNLMKQLQSGLTEFGKSIQQSVMAIDGTIREGDETLLIQDKSKGAKTNKEKADYTKLVKLCVNIFTPYSETASNADPATSDSQAILKILGQIALRAFVSSKATVADAIDAVRQDIIRSLLARYELLFEEFDVTDLDAYNQVYDPPIRCFFPLPNSSVDICDYAFQDEKKEEVIERIEELLDLKVEVLEEVEKSAGEDSTWNQQSSLSSCMSMGSTHSLESGNTDISTSSPKSYWNLAVGGIVALVAGGISYLYMND